MAETPQALLAKRFNADAQKGKRRKKTNEKTQFYNIPTAARDAGKRPCE